METETNAETSETNIKMDTFGNRYGINTVQTRTKIGRLSEPKDHVNHAAKLKKSSKWNNLFPKPVKITQCKWGSRGGLF
jgi:hypothetical protein